MPRGGRRPGAGRKKGATPPLARAPSVRLHPLLLERYEAEAARRGITTSALLREAIASGAPGAPPAVHNP
mgnify:CR=1 FL=1